MWQWIKVNLIQLPWRPSWVATALFSTHKAASFIARRQRLKSGKYHGGLLIRFNWSTLTNHKSTSVNLGCCLRTPPKAVASFQIDDLNRCSQFFLGSLIWLKTKRNQESQPKMCPGAEENVNKNEEVLKKKCNPHPLFRASSEVNQVLNINFLQFTNIEKSSWNIRLETLDWYPTVLTSLLACILCHTVLD